MTARPETVWLIAAFYQRIWEGLNRLPALGYTQRTLWERSLLWAVHDLALLSDLPAQLSGELRNLGYMETHELGPLIASSLDRHFPADRLDALTVFRSTDDAVQFLEDDFPFYFEADRVADQALWSQFFDDVKPFVERTGQDREGVSRWLEHIIPKTETRRAVPAPARQPTTPEPLQAPQAPARAESAQPPVRRRSGNPREALPDVTASAALVKFLIDNQLVEPAPDELAISELAEYIASMAQMALTMSDFSVSLDALLMDHGAVEEVFITPADLHSLLMAW